MRGYIKINEMYISGKGWVKFYNTEKQWQEIYEAEMVSVEYVDVKNIAGDEIVTTGSQDITNQDFRVLARKIRVAQLREEISHKDGNRRNFKLVQEFPLLSTTKKYLDKYLKVKGIVLNDSLVTRIL